MLLQYLVTKVASESPRHTNGSRTLYRGNVRRVREVSFNRNLDIIQDGKLDGREDVVGLALLEQDSRVGREVARGQCSGQHRRVVLAIRVFYDIGLPSGGRSSEQREQQSETRANHGEEGVLQDEWTQPDTPDDRPFLNISTCAS